MTIDEMIPKDIHSYSRPNEMCVSHLHWDARMDFDNKVIRATATWSLAGHAAELILDCKDLLIEEILVDGTVALFTLGDVDAILGQALSIALPAGAQKVTVRYVTSPHAEALQWLSAEQTSGGSPFLFTQSQAILARSWVPCQDSPGVRFTYDAVVNVPANLLPLMSASNPQVKNADGCYRFEMKQAIPSYLLALAVGDVSFSAISDRCGIYAEEHVLQKAVWEFADLEKMVEGAEALYGAYAWERYDVIVLPASFPFGGMENPRLTFATPTILAGDRSLTSLIAHELAHSWSGNLVTNATWNDFWLNEGFTVYFEHRIMEKLYGRDYSEMLASLALEDVKATIVELADSGMVNDTKLKLELEGRNPDDGVTDIAYNKGYFFLRYIEERFGKDRFDAFLTDYFSANAFRAMNTDGFIRFIKSFYSRQYSVVLPDSLFDSWIYSTGLPLECPTPISNRFSKVDEVTKHLASSGVLDMPAAKAWSTHEWLHFLNALPDSLSLLQMEALDKTAGFTASENAEILTAWLTLVIRHEYTIAFPKLEVFLLRTGRRKFLNPLYTELAKTEKGKAWAKQVYERARPFYHFVATNTFDKLLRS